MSMTIGAWVRAARTHKGMTQEELGDQLGLTKGNISAWEKERHEPSYSQMRKIAEVTGYPFFENDATKPAGKWPLADDTLIALSRASPEAQATIEAFARYTLGLPAMKETKNAAA